MFHVIPLAINKAKKLNGFLIPFFLISILFVLVPIVIIVYHAFFGIENSFDAQRFEVFQPNIITSIFQSFYITLVTIFFCLTIGYPLAYFLSGYKSFVLKGFLITLITLPIWSNYFIKLIGLKTVFDYWNGSLNSTYGIFYTVIGMIYIYLPITVLTIFNSLEHMSVNLILASKDLGQNRIGTLFKVIIPHTKTAIFAAISLTFFPAFFSVTVSEFLNNDNSSKMIGEIIHNLSSQSLSNQYARSTIFLLVFSIGLMVFAGYLLVKLFFRFISYFKKPMLSSQFA